MLHLALKIQNKTRYESRSLHPHKNDNLTEIYIIFN